MTRLPCYNLNEYCLPQFDCGYIAVWNHSKQNHI